MRKESFNYFQHNIHGEIYDGDNFDVNKHFYETISGYHFNFQSKNERIRNIDEIINSTNDNYRKTSEQFVDNLMNNYTVFMNIGKYVEKIDKNIGSVMSAQKAYSSYLQNLRKNVEEFSIDYIKYLKEVEIIDSKENKKNTNSDNIYFELNEEEAKTVEFNIDEFLNPQKGSKKWLEEQAEKIRVLINEKKYPESLNLIKEIRNYDLENIDYDMKNEIDNVYNYLIEKLTISVSRCGSSKEVVVYLEYIKSLGCTGLAIDTFLNWISKKLKNKINKIMTNEEDKANPELKLKKIIDDYFSSLDKFILTLEKYFQMEKNYAFSSYIVPWLKHEIQSMTKNVEVLFSKIKTIGQLKDVMRHINQIFVNFDKKGMSAKYIFDLHFLNDIKLSLESIINHCIKLDTEGVAFELKEYEFIHNSKTFKINCVHEMGNSIKNIGIIISEFINEFLNNKQNFTGVIFLEEYFFEQLLAKEFIVFIKNKINKNMSNNLEVQPFFDNADTMASSNEILINNGISILSIESLFDFYLTDLNNNSLVMKSTLDSLQNIKVQINEIKTNYFSNLFRIKIESHFFKFFDQNKGTLSKDTSDEFKEPHRAFFVYFMFTKNLTKIIKSRVNSEAHLSYFIMDNQFVNLLKIIESLKILNRLYDTEFNFSSLGVNGLEMIIYGVYFAYYCLNKLLGFDKENKYKAIVESFLEEIIQDFGKMKKMAIERFVKNKQLYQENIIKYIMENKAELIKGF